MTVKPDGSVHPVADLFPMMTDEELADLAADIEANGLLYPIVLDAEGQLIDGRNRLRACQIAKVEPTYTTLNGHEPTAYILAANLARRQMTAGQKAMMIARTAVFSKDSTRSLAGTYGVSRGMVGYASVVQQYAADLGDRVLAGAMSLNEAYEQARAAKAARDGVEEQTRLANARLSELRRVAPDLAELVPERMTIDEAMAAMREREKQRKQDAELATRALVEMVQAANSGIATPELRRRARSLYSHEAATQRGYPLSVAVISAAAEHLGRLAEEWDTDADS